MAAGPIPWDRIKDWCEDHAMDREAAEVLTTAILRVDAERAEAAEAKRRLEELSGAGSKR